MLHIAIASAFFVAEAAASIVRSHALQQQMLSIVNGTVVGTPSKDFSSFALITQPLDKHAWAGCGAAIISPSWAMTAAHCMGGGAATCKSFNGTKVVGLTGGDVKLNYGKIKTVKRKGGHGSFSVTGTAFCMSEWDGKCSHGHDIVLIKLASSLPSWVKPVPLNFDANVPAAGTKLEIIGFGNANVLHGSLDSQLAPSHDLRKAHVTTTLDSTSGCKAVYAGGYGCSDLASEAAATHKDQQICAVGEDANGKANGEDACAGDSGSPVYATVSGTKKVVGIVSYGGNPMKGAECGNHEWPGIYSRVGSFKKFVCKHVKDISECPKVLHS